MLDNIRADKQKALLSGIRDLRFIYLFVGLVWTIVLAILYLQTPEFLQAIERQWFDHLLRATSAGTPPSHCVVVAIDEKSLESFGQWPWPRYRIALLLEKIRRMNPRVVGIDILFAEPDRSSLIHIQKTLKRDLNLDIGFTGVPEGLLDHDRILADILAKGPFVLGYYCWMKPDGALNPKSCPVHPISIARKTAPFDPNGTPALPSASCMVCNLDILTRAAASSGFVHVIPDPDGLIRRIPLLMKWDREVLPSFVLAVLAQAEHRNQVIWRNDSTSGFLLRLADIDIPVDAAAQMGIRYRNTAHRIPLISAADILSDMVNPEVISGKRVFVGTTAAGLMDTIATPVDPVFSGVELHATVAENILSRYFWSRPAWVRLLEMVVFIAIVLVIGFMVGKKGFLWGASGTIVLLVVLWMGSSWAMERHGLYVSPLFPMLSAGFSFVGFMSIRFVRESYWKTYFQSAFVKTAIQAQRFRSDKEAADLASRHKSDFLAHMSHEIRTPMNAILGIAEVLSETDLDAQQRQYLQTLYQSGEILLNIINDILDLSKIEAGQIRLETIAFDLRNLFQDTVEVMRVQARQKGIPILLDVDSGLPGIWMGDPTRVRQIVVNLIGNAIKFTDTGNIRVNVSPRDPQNLEAGIVFQVADTGIGIAPERRDEIFSPFLQEDVSTTRKYGGTGLGLTICRRLAELMGGTIRVESELGKGSTFIVDLPLQVGREASMDSMADRKPASHGLGESSKGKVSMSGLRVLLAEDVAVNRRVVELYLKDTGLELHSVENGKEALDRHRAETFDVILMDMEMPVMDGLEATAAIREWEAEQGRPSVPIVALTAHAFEEKRQQCFEAGCTHYLTKPVKKADLIDLLHRIFQDTGRLRPSEDISTENHS